MTNVPNLTRCSIILDRNLVIANRRVSWVHLKHIISSNFNHIFRKNVQFPPTESMKAFNQTSACPKNDVNDVNSFHNDIKNIKSNLLKNAYPPFSIDKVIKKYLDYNFFSNQNQLKTNLKFINLNYHISATFHTISK